MDFISGSSSSKSGRPNFPPSSFPLLCLSQPKAYVTKPRAHSTMILSLLPDWLDPVEQDQQHYPSTTTATAHGSPYLPFGALPVNVGVGGRGISLPHTPGGGGYKHYGHQHQQQHRPHSTSTVTRYNETSPTPTSLTKTIRHAVLHNVLRYKIHLHTLVEFNDAGKIVYVRDLIDLRDLWEGIVPFGRETAWVGRRLGGLGLAGLGKLFLSGKTAKERDERMGDRDKEGDDEDDDEEGEDEDDVDYGQPSNSLGLDMNRTDTAPDVDSGGEGLGLA
jgi:hypothetical protein